MARTVETILTLKDQMSAKLKGIQRQVALTSGKMKKIGAKINRTGQNLTRKVTTPLVGVGAAAVKVNADFEKQMSSVQAISGATGKEFEKLEKAAQTMGTQLGYSATDTAKGLEYMALAGYDTQKSLKMLPNVLNLARAGNMELGLASDMVTDASSALGLSMGQTKKLVDQMAKASSKSNTSVEQLGDAILKIGGTAKGMKGGTTELTTALGILADNGTKSAEGGTALRNVLLGLKSDKFEKVFGKQVRVYDEATGKMRSLKDIFADMRKAMASMTDEQRDDAITKAFNKNDLKDVNALLSTTADRWDTLGGAIDKSNGSAKKMAATMLNNLQGQIDVLKSNLETAGIGIGKILNPMIKNVVSKINNIVKAFNNLDEKTKKKIVNFAIALAAIGPSLIVLGKLTMSVANLGIKFSKFLGWLSKFQGVAALIASPSVAIIATIGALAAAFAVVAYAIYDNWSMISKTINSVKEPIKKNLTEIRNALANVFGGTDAGNKLKTVFKTITDFIATKLMQFIQWLPTATKAIADFLSSEKFQTTASTILSVISQIITAVVEGVTWFINYIKPIIAEISPKVMETLTVIGNGLKSIWEQTAPLIKDLIVLIAAVFAFLAPKVAWFAESVKPQIITVLTQIMNGFKLLVEGITIYISGFIKYIRGVIEFITGVFTGDWDKAWGGIKLIFEGHIAMIKGIFKGLLGALVELTGGQMALVYDSFTFALDGIKSLFSGACDSITGFFNDLGGNIQDALAGTFDWIGDKIDSFLNSIGELKDKAVNFAFGNNATGTQYWKGGTTWVGENGPELVTLPSGSKVYPHTRSMNMAGGQSVVVNVNIAGNVIGNSEFANYMAEAVSSRILVAMANT